MSAALIWDTGEAFSKHLGSLTHEGDTLENESPRAKC